MLEVHLLGNGGMVPLPGRYLSALMARCEGTGVLIDCGEGTQMAIRAAGLGFKQIGVICLTHFHADHIAGLPGLLLTIGNTGRIEPVTVVGPKHLGQVVDCLRVIAPQLPYRVEYLEIPGNGPVLSLGLLEISAQLVEHWIPCYAYRLDVKRQGRFDPEKAKALGVPVRQWSALQGGTTVEVNGRTVESSAVVGRARKGIRLCYATDLRPSGDLAEFARGADLFVCEGMYGDPQLLDKAIEHRHCLFGEAARMAQQGEVGELWLTHFSPAMPHPEEYIRHAGEIFPNAWVDKAYAELRFADE